MTLTNEFWEYVENHKKTKTIKSVYNWLQKDNLSDIIVDRNVFWIELTCPSTNTLPNYIYKFIIAWGKKQGYKHLYDSEIN